MRNPRNRVNSSGVSTARFPIYFLGAVVLVIFLLELSGLTRALVSALGIFTTGEG
jgi:hypothetical protein